MAMKWEIMEGTCQLAKGVSRLRLAEGEWFLELIKACAGSEARDLLEDCQDGPVIRGLVPVGVIDDP